MPTYGTVFSETNQWRDYLVSAEGTFPYTDSVHAFNGNYTTSTGIQAKASKNKQYRLLLR